MDVSDLGNSQSVTTQYSSPDIYLAAIERGAATRKRGRRKRD